MDGGYCETCKSFVPDWALFITEDKHHAFCSVECAKEMGYVMNEYDELVTNTCPVCGQVGEEGTERFYDDGVYICESCFNAYMDEKYGCFEWRPNDHEEPWDGGYYDYWNGREWLDTGIYWTEI